jgi:hypothetical protein
MHIHMHICTCTDFSGRWMFDSGSGYQIWSCSRTCAVSSGMAHSLWGVIKLIMTDVMTCFVWGFMSARVCVHARMCVYIYTYMHTYGPVTLDQSWGSVMEQVCMIVCMYVCIYAFIRDRMCATGPILSHFRYNVALGLKQGCVCVCMYNIYIYIHTYIYIYTCIYIYI